MIKHCLIIWHFGAKHGFIFKMTEEVLHEENVNRSLIWKSHRQSHEVYEMSDEVLWL